MEIQNDISILLDNFLFQRLIGKISYEQLLNGIQYYEKQQLPKWNLRFGFSLSVYSNDHFINGKPHFHIDNKSSKIFCKLDFDGNILECEGEKSIPKNIIKEIRYFISIEQNRKTLIDMWNEKNPTLIVCK